MIYLPLVIIINDQFIFLKDLILLQVVLMLLLTLGQTVFMLFPPLHLVDNFIARFLQLNVTYGLLICPFWPSQSYYPLLLELLIDDPFLISASVLVDHAMLPRSVSHFLVSSISSKPALHKEYLERLPLAYSGVSTVRHCVPTFVAGSRLHIGVLQGRLIIAQYL